MTRNRTNNGSTRRTLVNSSSNIVPMTSGLTRNRHNRLEEEDAAEGEGAGANRGTISNFFNTFIRQQQQQQTLLSQFQQFNSLQQQLPQNQRAFLPLTITNTNGRIGGSNTNSSNITIAPTTNTASSSSTLRNKIVYALQCAYCQITVCRRAMKAILLADTKIELYSTDIPPTP